MQLSQTQEMLLGKLIDFKAVWDYNSIDIRHNMFNLFFDWSDLEKDARPSASKSGMSTTGDGTGDKKKDDKGKDAAIDDPDAGGDG